MFTKTLSSSHIAQCIMENHTKEKSLLYSPSRSASPSGVLRGFALRAKQTRCSSPGAPLRFVIVRRCRAFLNVALFIDGALCYFMNRSAKIDVAPPYGNGATSIIAPLRCRHHQPTVHVCIYHEATQCPIDTTQLQSHFCSNICAYWIGHHYPDHHP